MNWCFMKNYPIFCKFGIPVYSEKVICWLHFELHWLNRKMGDECFNFYISIFCQPFVLINWMGFHHLLVSYTKILKPYLKPQHFFNSILIPSAITKYSKYVPSSIFVERHSLKNWKRRCRNRITHTHTHKIAFTLMNTIHEYSVRRIKAKKIENSKLF